jgi:hypothetical protein
MKQNGIDGWKEYLLGVVLLLLLLLVLHLMLSDDAAGAVGGTDLRIYDVFETADSVHLEHFRDGTASDHYWIDTNQVDTTIPEANLDTALHIVYVQLKIDAGSEWLTSKAYVYPNLTGGDIDSIPVDIRYMEADSTMLIVTVSSSSDTAHYGANSSVDTTLTGVLDSLYTITVVNQYDTDWQGAFELIVDNRPGGDGTITPPGSVDQATVFVYYYRNGEPQKGARLSARFDQVATDSVTGTTIGPFTDWEKTDTAGYAGLVIPKSYIFNDSSNALYDIILRFAGKTVGSWYDYFVPDQDTVRLEME